MESISDILLQSFHSSAILTAFYNWRIISQSQTKQSNTAEQCLHHQ